MEYKKLGLTDLEISQIGFGCWAIGGHGYGKVDDTESIKAIRQAIDLGINFFDTADVYGFGHSEEILGKALGDQKKDVVIATKFGINWDENGKTFKDCSPKRVVSALDDSLNRLKIDCIPLYQIHWHDNITPISEIMDELKKCQEKGKIRYIGCSNLSQELIFEGQKIHRIDSLQDEFNIIKRESESKMKVCYEIYKMGVLVYSVLARGLFSGKYKIGSTFAANDTRSQDMNFQNDHLERNLEIVHMLNAIGAKYGKGSTQVAIRWVLDNPFITCSIVGIKKPEQITEISQATGWILDKDDWKIIDNVVLSGEKIV
jgi:myo-inositol catabolism protein IolS